MYHQDIFIYCRDTERQLQAENIQLRAELNDTQLDLDDAKKSRRELQQQVNLLTQRMGQSTAESEYIKVRVKSVALVGQVLTFLESQPLYYGFS